MRFFTFIGVVIYEVLTIGCSYKTGNPHEVLKSIQDRHKLEPVGEPSLQNAIEMARGSMRYISPSPFPHFEQPRIL